MSSQTNLFRLKKLSSTKGGRAESSKPPSVSNLTKKILSCKRVCLDLDDVDVGLSVIEDITDDLKKQGGKAKRAGKQIEIVTQAVRILNGNSRLDVNKHLAPVATLGLAARRLDKHTKLKITYDSGQSLQPAMGMNRMKLIVNETKKKKAVARRILPLRRNRAKIHGDQSFLPKPLPDPINGSWYNRQETLAMLVDPDFAHTHVIGKLQRYLIRRGLVPVKSESSLRQLRIDYRKAPETCNKYWGAGYNTQICDYDDLVDTVRKKVVPGGSTLSIKEDVNHILIVK